LAALVVAMLAYQDETIYKAKKDKMMPAQSDIEISGLPIQQVRRKLHG
jgi:hypothetical protein